MISTRSTPFLGYHNLLVTLGYFCVKQGWNSLETIIAAEGLALTLQSAGSLKEAEELLERYNYNVKG